MYPIPEGAKTDPGPCPKCGGEGPVMHVRSKTDRNWWDEWQGCMACVAPIAFATQIQDEGGAYDLILPGGPQSREARKKDMAREQREKQKKKND